MSVEKIPSVPKDTSIEKPKEVFTFLKSAIEKAQLAGTVRFPEIQIPVVEGLESALEESGVHPLLDGSLLIVSGWSDIGILYTMGLVEIGDTDTAHPVRRGLVRLAYPDGMNKDSTYQFPARLINTFPKYTPADKVTKERWSKRPASDEHGEEHVPDMTEELRDIEERWRSGETGDTPEALREYTRLPNLRLFKGPYEWSKGKLYIQNAAGEKIEVTHEEQYALLAKAKEGDVDAREKLITIHLGLVLSVVEAMQNLFGGEGDDMVQAGLEGLLKSVERYDPEKSARFSTYAVYGIESAIRRQHIQGHRLIRTPAHLYSDISQYHRAYDLLEKKLEREPLVREIADVLNMSEHDVRRLEMHTHLKRKMVGFAESPDVVETGYTVPEPSLDMDSSVERDIVRQKLVVYADEVLQHLTPRELKVIKLRFGFSKNNREYSLEEIARIFDVTKERIRQIEDKALRKLRYRGEKAGLGDFISD